jgi:predicted nucleic acid-binding protein
MILLDTGVVSAVLNRRRRGEVGHRVANTVASFLDSHESIGLPGIVFQEVQSGIADTRRFRKVLSGIRDSFPIMLAGKEDHLRAAQIANGAAATGITASTLDALIAGQAIGLESELLTVDPDFGYLADFTDRKVIFLGEGDAAT